MKKKIFLLLATLLVGTGIGTSSGRKYLRYVFSSARNTFQSSAAPSRDSASVAQLQIEYRFLRDSVEKKRRKLGAQYLSASTPQSKKAVLKEAGNYLRTTLINKIYPSWYGTDWDFNGITETPCQGKIACGYFVSTTLKHIGVNVNRYKLAQKYSHAIVKSVCTDVIVFSDFEKMMSYVKDQPDDVYVVGLDTHVGIISKQGEQIQFVHSSYVGTAQVLSEEAAYSAVLGGSAIYVVGNMTSNPSLLRSWLTGSVVKIIE